jgi:hypothetical protein
MGWAGMNPDLWSGCSGRALRRSESKKNKLHPNTNLHIKLSSNGCQNENGCHWTLSCLIKK